MIHMFRIVLKFVQIEIHLVKYKRNDLNFALKLFIVRIFA